MQIYVNLKPVETWKKYYFYSFNVMWWKVKILNNILLKTSSERNVTSIKQFFDALLTWSFLNCRKYLGALIANTPLIIHRLTELNVKYVINAGVNCLRCSLPAIHRRTRNLRCPPSPVWYSAHSSAPMAAVCSPSRPLSNEPLLR